MQTPTPALDDATLAALIAGTLPDERRAEVLEYLYRDADARELLAMACRAFTASFGFAPPTDRPMPATAA